jgi:hypothetical protein
MSARISAWHRGIGCGLPVAAFEDQDLNRLLGLDGRAACIYKERLARGEPGSTCSMYNSLMEYRGNHIDGVI